MFLSAFCVVVCAERAERGAEQKASPAHALFSSLQPASVRALPPPLHNQNTHRPDDQILATTNTRDGLRRSELQQTLQALAQGRVRVRHEREQNANLSSQTTAKRREDTMAALASQPSLDVGEGKGAAAVRHPWTSEVRESSQSKDRRGASLPPRRPPPSASARRRDACARGERARPGRAPSRCRALCCWLADARGSVSLSLSPSRQQDPSGDEKNPTRCRGAAVGGRWAEGGAGARGPAVVARGGRRACEKWRRRRTRASAAADDAPLIWQQRQHARAPRSRARASTRAPADHTPSTTRHLLA